MNGAYTQRDFGGGMNYLVCDTDIAENEYRIGFNLRNRNGNIDSIGSPVKDTKLPQGIVQELITFGNFLIVFVSGQMYYRLRTQAQWTKVVEFTSMSKIAPRYWTSYIPVTTTLYGRQAVADNANGGTNYITPTAAVTGDIPGILVQDGTTQPVFVFISDGQIKSRTTQTYEQWLAPIPYSDPLKQDKREYVPVGTSMAYGDGILYIVAPNGSEIYRSVSGRPLDFMVNVKQDGTAGGTASTTSIGVGVGSISSIQMMLNNTLLVCAANTNYTLAKNMTQNAVTIFGEYTYIRNFLFESTCLSDRAIITTPKDTNFIDYTGVRSALAVLAQGNEGRNSVYSAKVNGIFEGIRQSVVAAVNFDNYEIYAVNTIFGYGALVYDAVIDCWSSLDLPFTTAGIKQFAKIELDTLHLYAVTTNNELYELFIGSAAKKTIITRSITASDTVKDSLGDTSLACRAELRAIEVGFVADSGGPVDAVNANVSLICDNAEIKANKVEAAGKSLYNAVVNSIDNKARGWKIAVKVEDTSNLSLTQIHLNSELNFGINPLLSQK